MASRLKIIFMSAIPVGASIIYLLWTLSWKKKKHNKAVVSKKQVDDVPVIQVTAETDKETQQPVAVQESEKSVLVDESQAVNASRNGSVSDAGNFSLSDELEVSSGSHRHSPIDDLVEVQQHNAVSPSFGSEPETNANSLVLTPEHQDKVCTSTCDKDELVKATANDILFCVDMNTNYTVDFKSDAKDVSLSEANVPTGVTKSSDESSFQVEAIEDAAVAINSEVQFSEPSLELLSSEICVENGYPWGSSEVPDSVDCEVIAQAYNATDVTQCDTEQKDSCNSVCDKNSCNSSRDRNDNDCKRNNKRNRNGNQQLSASKDKTVKSHAFDFPTEFCGQLIGRRGHYVALIKEKCGVEIYIRPKVYNTAWQVVTLEGTQQQVNKALDMIRRRFPSKFYPGIDFNTSLPDVPVVPAELMQLSLPTGVSIEVVVSNVVSPNHIFVQQPTHPTFPSLERQTINMRACYRVENVPCLPRPIDVGVICAAPIGDNWFRAQIVQTYQDTDEYDLKLVDYGGYIHMSGSLLRQIRSDFMLVPFQAIECYLGNVIPLKDDEDFAPEAKSALEELVNGSILQCFVTAFEADGVPYVELTKLVENGTQAIVINRELVHRELARWLEM